MHKDVDNNSSSNPFEISPAPIRSRTKPGANRLAILLSWFKITVCVIAALGASGCMSSKPDASNLLPSISPDTLRLKANMAIQVTVPSETPTMVPASGMAGSIPFSPPQEYLQRDTLCRAVRAASQGAAILAQTTESSLANSKETDFVLEVTFGDIELGMDFPGEGVTVDFPSTWRLLTQNGRQTLITRTVQAHGGGNSLSGSSACQKALERAIRDAIAKGLSAVTQQIKADLNSQESLELLACVAAAPEIKRGILLNVETNTNPVSLQMALNKAFDPEIGNAAKLRLTTVVPKSTNLAALIALSDPESNFSVDFKSLSRERAINLLDGWRTTKDEAAVHRLLLVGRDPYLKGNDLALQAEQTAEDIIKSTHEIITEMEYQRAFAAPYGGFLRPWMPIVRREMGTAINMDTNRLSGMGTGLDGKVTLYCRQLDSRGSWGNSGPYNLIMIDMKNGAVVYKSNDPNVLTNGNIRQPWRSAKEVIQLTREIISEGHNFPANPSGEGELIPLLYKIREQISSGKWDNNSPFTVMVKDKKGEVLLFLASSGYFNAQIADGNSFVTFSMNGLYYELEEDANTRTVRETVRRTKATSNQTVLTEVITLNGTRYSKSKILAP